MMTPRLFGMSALALGLMALPTLADDTQMDLPGPIDSLQDLQDTGKMVFKMADTNNDGQISQQEAIDLGNTVVGGYFFRADKDGNGVVTKEEGQQAREALLAQKPFLRALANRAKATNPQGTAAARDMKQGLMSLLDTNTDGQLQAAELKQMIQTTVQSVYSMADTNRDGQMSPSEVNAAMVGAAKSAAQGIYQQADADGNGQLSLAEFDKAISQPAAAVFHMLDANGDGQVSPQEFQAAERTLSNQVRRLYVPEPANSAKNLLESGRKPAEVAPVPNFNNAATPRPAQPVVPVQPRQQ